MSFYHDDVIKWKHFPRYWPCVWGIHRSPVNTPHKCQWRGALMFSLICAWINAWVNNREAGDLRRHRAHYDVIVMIIDFTIACGWAPIFYETNQYAIKFSWKNKLPLKLISLLVINNRLIIHYIFECNVGFLLCIVTVWWLNYFEHT